MTIERLQEILDAFGADHRRWPAPERDAARNPIARSGEARSRFVRETLADLVGREEGRGHP